jgi:hypothetical protein
VSDIGAGIDGLAHDSQIVAMFVQLALLVLPFVELGEVDRGAAIVRAEHRRQGSAELRQERLKRRLREKHQERRVRGMNLAEGRLTGRT